MSAMSGCLSVHSGQHCMWQHAILPTGVGHGADLVAGGIIGNKASLIARGKQLGGSDARSSTKPVRAFTDSTIWPGTARGRHALAGSQWAKFGRHRACMPLAAGRCIGHHRGCMYGTLHFESAVLMHAP